MLKRATTEVIIELLGVLEAPSESLKRDVWRMKRRFGSAIVQECIQELHDELDRHDLSSDSGLEVDQCR